jgi:putative endonuclease
VRKKETGFSSQDPEFRMKRSPVDKKPGKRGRTPWFLYLIECVDRSIYTGIEEDVAARYAVHKKGTGARYTRSHPPRKLMAVVEYPSRSAASQAEYLIKQLTPREKRAFARTAKTGG